MLLVSVFADTRCSPGVDVEPFPSWQPVLTNFFWAAWDELESLAVAVVAVVLDPATLEEALLMGLEQVAAEALRVCADAEALVLLLLGALPSHVDPTFHRFVCMLELPRHHLFGAWSQPYLFD